MSNSVAMFDRYNELMSDAQIRNLMSVLVRGDSDETLDFVGSSVSIKKLVLLGGSFLGEPRQKIIGFFNALWMSGLDTISDEFWWEMRYRLLELLAVSIALEALKLRFTIGCTEANSSNIPQALIFVKEHLDTCTSRSTFNISSAFDSACAKQKGLLDVYLRHFSRDD